MGLLRGNPRQAVDVPCLLVVPRLAQDRLLPFRQFRSADVSDLFSLRAGRFPEPDALSESRRDKPRGAHRYSRPGHAPDCLGGFRREGGPVFRHSFLGCGQPGILRGEGAPSPARARPVLRESFRRIQEAYLSRGIPYLAGLAGGDEFRGERPVYGQGFRNRVGADILSVL